MRHSTESRMKISIGVKKALADPEVRAKLSASLKGKRLGPQSDEHRAKRSAALKGKEGHPQSAETRAKISASLREHHRRLREGQ